jgi:hypothetical protein
MNKKTLELNISCHEGFFQKLKIEWVKARSQTHARRKVGDAIVLVRDKPKLFEYSTKKVHAINGADVRLKKSSVNPQSRLKTPINEITGRTRVTTVHGSALTDELDAPAHSKANQW